MPATLNNTGVLFNDSSQQSTAYIGHRVFFTASNNTFTPPAGVTSIKITAIGGGGGGGARDFSGSVRYAGAGACIVANVLVTGGTTYIINIGAGGAGSNPNFSTQTGEDGENGGETWFGVNSSTKLLSAGGGTGSTGTWNFDPCSGYYITTSNGADGTSYITAGTVIRNSDNISAGGLSWGNISGSPINWNLPFLLFGSSNRSVNGSGSTTPVVWSATSAYFPGQGGQGQYSAGNTASGGVGGVMIIEY